MNRLPPRAVVVDASVLINFLCVNRMDLIANHSHAFIATEHVVGEVSEPSERRVLRAAFDTGTPSGMRIADPAEVSMFGALAAPGRLGAGECSAIAAAVHRQHSLAMDDRRAMREARQLDPRLEVLTTADLMVSMIREEPLDVVEADRIKHAWATQHRFRLGVETFGDLLQ